LGLFLVVAELVELAVLRALEADIDGT